MSDFTGVKYVKVNKDLIRSVTTVTWKYYLALGITFTIVLYGAGVYWYQSVNGLGVWGVNEPNFWGLDITNFIFWIGFSLSGTLLSAILLLTKSHWRNPIYRVAELMTGIALIVAGVVVLTHVGRPWRVMYNLPYPNFRYLWPSFRSPLMWDVIGLVAYLSSSVIFLLVGSIPDFAALRDNVTGWKQKVYRVLSFGWTGSDTQWRHFRRAYTVIAVFIIPVAVSMHSVTAWFQSLTINPGVHSTIYPPYFVTGALLSGCAGVILIIILVRRFMGLQDYFLLSHIDHLAKLLVLASMLISYIYLVELFVPWYRQENFELMVLATKVRGSYAPFFWTMIVFNSIIPLALLKKSMRRNTVALFLISIGVQIGMYFERYLMVLPGQNIGPLPSTWSSYSPTWVEFSLLIWTVALFAFIFLLSVKLIPVVSIFEVKEILEMPMRSDSPLNDHATSKNIEDDFTAAEGPQVAIEIAASQESSHPDLGKEV